MSFDDNLRGDTATTTLRVNDGKFRADIAEDERIWRSTVAGMSRESLRLSIAEDKLAAALAKHGAESNQVKRATLALKDAEARAGDQALLTSRRFAMARTEMERTNRGAASGSRLMGGLSRGFALASTALIGGAGLAFALRSTVHAAMDWQVQQGKIQVSLKNANVSWTENRKQILDSLEAQVRMSAFQRSELASTLSALITRTGDVNEALRLNALVANVARGRNISLEAAVRLVTRASIGQVGSLRRLGIDVKAVTTAQDKLRESGFKATFQEKEHAKALDAAATKIKVIALLEEKYGGFASKYAHSAAGAQDRFNATLHESEIIIGTALLPTVTHLLQEGSDWLEQMNRTGKLQRDVNGLMRTGGQIVRGFGDAFGLVRDVLGPVTDLLGGTRTAVKDVLELMALYKLAKIAGAIRGIGVAWGFVGTQATIAGGKVVAAEGEMAAGAAAARTGLLAGIGSIPLIGTAVVGGILLGNWANARDAAANQRTAEKLLAMAKKGQLTPDALNQIMRAPDWAISPEMKKKILAAYEASKGPRVPNMANPHGSAAAVRDFKKKHPAGGDGGGGGGAPARTEQDIQTDISRAAAQHDSAAQKRYLQELDAYYQRKINALEANHHRTQAQQAQLQQLYDQQAATEGQIAQLEQDAAAKTAKAKRDATAKVKKAQGAALDKVRTQEQKLVDAYDAAKKTEQLNDDKKRLLALIRFYKEQSRNDDLSVKARQAFAEKRRKAQAALDAIPAKALRQRIHTRETQLQNQLLADEVKKNTAAEKRDYDALIAFYRRMSKDMDLTKAERDRFKRKMLEEEKKEQAFLGKGSKGGSSTSARKQFEGMAYDFLSSLQGTLNQYGGDLFGPGDLSVGGGSRGVATHTAIQTEILRSVNKNVKNLSDAARNPGSRYGYKVLTTALDDPFSF